MAFLNFGVRVIATETHLAPREAPETLLAQGCSLKRLFSARSFSRAVEDSMSLGHHLQTAIHMPNAPIVLLSSCSSPLSHAIREYHLFLCTFSRKVQ
jgi:hypothetical protein